MHQKTKKEVIEQFIIEQIDSGELKENQKLLTEKELCLKFSVSRMTVNNAMNKHSITQKKIINLTETTVVGISPK